MASPPPAVGRVRGEPERTWRDRWSPNTRSRRPHSARSSWPAAGADPRRRTARWRRAGRG